MPQPVLPPDSLTLHDMQKLIAQMYGPKDEARGISGTFMWLMEEVGELAGSLRSGTHEDRLGEFHLGNLPLGQSRKLFLLAGLEGVENPFLDGDEMGFLQIQPADVLGGIEIKRGDEFGEFDRFHALLIGGCGRGGGNTFFGRSGGGDFFRGWEHRPAAAREAGGAGG